MSNAYLEAKNHRLLDFAKGMADPALLQPLLDVRPEYLDAAFDEVDKQYGSFDRYIRDGLGIDATTIEALRKAFLAG